MYNTQNSEDPREQAEAAFKQAHRAAKKGDLKEAERWSQVAERMSAAAKAFAALPPPQGSPAEEEAERAALRDRFKRFCDADIERRVWEFEAYVHQRYSERAAREGLPPPPPLRDPPYAKDSVWAQIGVRGEYDQSIAAMFARAIERQTIDYVREKLASEKSA